MRLHNRRHLAALDAGAAPETRAVRTRRKEPTVTTISEAPVRPPRPQHIDDETRADAARRLGMKPSEITAVVDTDAGRIVTTADGTALIDVPVDRPDGAGQTGLLVYRGLISKDSGASRYVDPTTARQHTGTSEAWSVADLDTEAARLHVPAPAYGDPSGPSQSAWIGNDPIRARAVWCKIATGLGVDPAQAAHRNAEAAYCRKVIAASGWLSAAEAAAL
jgi:hypothetical protein